MADVSGREVDENFALAERFRFPLTLCQSPTDPQNEAMPHIAPS